MAIIRNIKGGGIVAQEAIAKITESEALAEAKIAEARAAAKRTVTEAESAARTDYDKAVAEAEVKVSEMLSKAEDAAAGASLEITSSAERECEKLRVLAKGRMNDAAAFIAEKVVKS